MDFINYFYKTLIWRNISFTLTSIRATKMIEKDFFL